MRILVLGVSGMLGSTAFRILAQSPLLEVWGSARSISVKKYFSHDLARKVITGIDVENIDCLMSALNQVRPELVVNCVGLVKQLEKADDPLYAMPINSLLPHRLAQLCALINARLVHVSTDCVFSGRIGGYLESDEPDAMDLYGRSKLLGEVNYPHAITLRTSIIGHELSSSHGLIDWFLSQQERIKGFTEAIFSGLPTCELSRVVRDFVIPNQDLHGLYHVAAEPISKYDLLNIVNLEYDKNLEIQRDNSVKINRSLDGSRFKEATGYVAPPWPQLIAQMRSFEQGAKIV